MGGLIGGAGKIDNPFVRWCSTCMQVGGLLLLGFPCVVELAIVVVEGVGALVWQEHWK